MPALAHKADSVLAELHPGAPPITIDSRFYDDLVDLYDEVRALGPSHSPSHYNAIRSLTYLPLSTQRDPAWALGIIRLTTAEPGLYLAYHPELGDWRYELVPTLSL